MESTNPRPPADADAVWMARALELARRGLGRVEPNPPVGCVVVRDGRAVGEGWPARFGGPHAEIVALAAAGDAAKGAVCYVTLEPCCHHGKTPPCTDALRRAGIARIVVGCLDPSEKVSGRGVAELREAGIDVQVGVCEAACRQLIAPFEKLHCQRRPWVHAKWAMSCDGRMAASSGDSRWISSEASRQQVHALRGRVDAILVGIETALQDDPQLTARPPGPRTPLRIVLDSMARLPVHSHLVRTAREIGVLVAVGPDAPAERVAALRSAGCEIWQSPESSRQASLAALLDELGRRDFTHLLVEGGPTVLGTFFELGEIDEVHAFIAPVLLGGRHARVPLWSEGASTMQASVRLADVQWTVLGPDGYLHGYVRWR